MKIIEYITSQYGKENLRNFLRFHKMGISEKYWRQPNKTIEEKAKELVKMMLKEDIDVLGVMTKERKFTDMLVAEIIKIFVLSSNSSLIWFDVFMSEFYDKWNNVFDYDKLSKLFYKSVVGVIGVTYKIPESNNKVNILISFTRFILSLMNTGTKTRIVLGLDLIQKENIEKMYGEEFNKMLDKVMLIKVN